MCPYVLYIALEAEKKVPFYIPIRYKHLPLLFTMILFVEFVPKNIIMAYLIDEITRE